MQPYRPPYIQIILDLSARRRHTVAMLLRRFFALVVLMTLLISATAPARAEEAKMNAIQTALGSTTISGYADTSIEWSFGNQTTTVQPVEDAEVIRPKSWWRALRSWLRAHRPW